MMASRTTAEPLSLPAVLAACSDQALSRMLTLRPDVAAPAPHDFAELASRIGAWSSVRTCVDGLDQFARQLVEAMCLLPVETTQAALGDLLGGVPPEDVQAGVSRLVERMLVLRRSERLTLVPTLRQVHHPAGLGPPLAELIRQTSAGTVERIARRAGVRPARSKAATVTALAEALSGPPLVRELVAAGPPGTVKLAEQLAAGPPLLTLPGGVYNATERTPAGWLLSRGLAVSNHWQGGSMPREVALALRGGRPFPDLASRRPELQSSPVDQPTVDAIAAEQALLTVRAVEALLELCGRTPLPLLSSGGVGVRELRRLAKALGRDEPATARLLELAAATGLLGIAGGGATAQPLPAYDSWRALELADRWAGLVAGWLAWDCQLSVAGSLDSKGRLVPPLRIRNAEPFARRRREALVGALDELSGSAADPVGLGERLRWDAPALWREPGDGQILIGGLLAELMLLGLTAQGALSGAGQQAAGGRLREAAALVAAHAPPVADTFVVQADLTAIVSGEPAAPLRAELELLADVESTGAASVYRFSATSVRRAFDAGRTADDILAFLERSASRGVPQPLRYLVTDLARTFGSLRVGAVGGYLRSDDPALLAELLRSKAVSRLGLRQIAPTVLVSTQPQDQLVSELRAAGFLAAPEGADGSLQITRPPALRAVPAAEVAKLAGRRPGIGPCFGPVEAVLAEALAGRSPAGRSAADLPLIDAPTIIAALRHRGLGRSQPSPTDLLVEQLTRHALLQFDAVDDDDDDEPPRPTEQVCGPAGVLELLQLACDQEWAVELTYGRGRDQLLAFPLETDRKRVLADFLPDGVPRHLLLADIHRVRVLSEDEEDELF